MSRLPILILGDTHFPFHCKKSLAAAVRLAGIIKPKIIIQIGDCFDLYSFSKFPKSLNVMTPMQEIKAGRKAAEEMWAALRKSCPSAECWGLKGNHDERLAKRITEALPEIEGLVGLGLWDFPGVQTLPAERDELIINEIIFMHGYRNLGEHLRYNLASTVCGHSHVGGVVYQRIKGKTLFELNAGYLGDPTTRALSYTKQKKISRWTKGVAVIDSLGPRFIPLG